MTGRTKPISVRPTEEQLERWRTAAAYYPRLSFSEYLRRLIDEGVKVELLDRRAAREVAARVEALGRLRPDQIERLRERGGDVADWPLADGSGAE